MEFAQVTKAWVSCFEVLGQVKYCLAASEEHIVADTEQYSKFEGVIIDLEVALELLDDLQSDVDAGCCEFTLRVLIQEVVVMASHLGDID